MNITAIEQAAERIRPYVKRTPLEYSETLSRELGAQVYVKYELFQKTGAFKVRGAFNKLLSLSPEEREKGIVAVSGGNHAQAVAYAAGVLGADAVILMPETSPKNYIEGTRSYGGTIDLQPTIAACFEGVKRYQEAGRVFIHPFDDSEVMAGQGTISLEILEDLPDTTDVVVSIGGGGLTGGVSAALKARSPGIRVWGVETEGADVMARSIAAGQPVELAAVTSIAKTLGSPTVSAETFALARNNLESVTIVPDAEAISALVFLLERLKVLTEPAASCTLAAARRLKDKFTPDSKVVLILCGGNQSVSDICGYLS
jgi:threonine dehydratase